MIDIKKIREEFEATVEQLARRGVEKENVQKAKDLDEKRRSLISETETLKAKRNSASKEIGMIAKQGGDIAAAKEEMRKIGDRIAEIDRQVVAIIKKQHEKAINILKENRTKLDELAHYLYQNETITGEEFMRILG